LWAIDEMIFEFNPIGRFELSHGITENNLMFLDICVIHQHT
jgi:hypothetical protein